MNSKDKEGFKELFESIKRTLYIISTTGTSLSRNDFFIFLPLYGIFFLVTVNLLGLADMFMSIAIFTIISVIIMLFAIAKRHIDAGRHYIVFPILTIFVASYPGEQSKPNLIAAVLYLIAASFWLYYIIALAFPTKKRNNDPDTYENDPVIK